MLCFKENAIERNRNSGAVQFQNRLVAEKIIRTTLVSTVSASHTEYPSGWIKIVSYFGKASGSLFKAGCSENFKPVLIAAELPHAKNKTRKFRSRGIQDQCM